ncbi:MAG: hypothetical protein EOP69_01040, partial [Spirochaetia bacterium]
MQARSAGHICHPDTPLLQNHRIRAALQDLALLVLGGWALLVTPAAAQPLGATVNVDSVPTIDRDRLDRKDPLVPRPAPNVPLSQPQADISVPQPTSATTMRGVRFEGSSINPQTLATAARVFAGAPLTRPTLQKLANSITALYAKSDIAFYAVSIPSQTMAGGIVTVQVVEGRIARYTLAKRTQSTPERLIKAQ